MSFISSASGDSMWRGYEFGKHMAQYSRRRLAYYKRVFEREEEDKVQQERPEYIRHI